MKNTDLAISVKDVTKDFVLPHEKHKSIKSSLIGLFRGRSKSNDTQHALRGISFDVKKGEFFGILGRNGSGKSTLLKILAEIYKPTRGSVKTDGKLVPFIELGVGFNPELTGRENVYLNGALLGFSRKEIDARYDEIVAFAELEEFMDQKLKNYSSGMQVRLAFSVATRAEADILLVDEVLAVGDADFQRKCYDFFKSLKKTGKTVVFVTHDMSAVREYCDRAILINDGVISHHGRPATIANEYLKLFNSSITTPGSSDNTRWGNAEATIGAITAETLDEGSGDLVIKTNIARATKKRIVLGIRIRDSMGRVVSAFNTEKLDDVGESVEIVTPNIYGNGVYAIDATIRQHDSSVICDNWDEATTFSVDRDITNSESVVPPTEIRTS